MQMPGYSPQTVYPFAVNGLLVVSQIWVIVIGGKYSFTSRVVGSFISQALILFVTPFLAHLGNGAGFWSVFLVLFIFGLVSGVGQASVFSMAGGLPFKYIGAVMLGQGIAGIATNILRAVDLIVWPVAKSDSNLYIGAVFYFLFFAVFMVICALLQFVLKNNEYAVFHLWNNPGFKPKMSDFSPLPSSSKFRLSPKSKPLAKQETLKSVIQTMKETLQSTEGLLYSLTLIFTITLLLFPGTTSDTYFKWINSFNLTNTEGWYQLCVVFIFNCFDTIGRSVGGNKRFDLEIRTVNLLSIGRVIFIATFLLTDFEVPPNWLFNSDWFKMLNLFVFAFSNGYLSTLCAVKAPDTVRESRRAIVGSYIGTFISIGVLLGAFLQIGMGPILALTPKEN